MNKSQRTTRRQTRHERQVANRLVKKRQTQAILESPDEEDVDPEDEDIDIEAGDEVVESDSVFDKDSPAEEPEEAAPIQKDYGMDQPMGMPAPMGPTSFDELDAAREAEDQARELRMASYDVEDLVRNILNHPMLDAGEKAAAIQDVGAGFQGRVDSILSENNPEDMQKDMDLLMLEALIATDRRNTSVTERMGDWITKAILTTKGRKGLSNSQFALVRTQGGKTVKKYPIHDKAHVRNALARAAQMMKRGGLAAADAKAALPKIHAAAKRMGIGQMKKDSSAILIEKDAKGDWRWVGWPTNNFIDWHGDILSKEAHQEYVTFLDKNPGMAPVFMSWHTPGTERQSPVDYWNFENGFMIMSGKLTEPEAASLLKAKTKTDLGMSYQGFGLRESNDPRVVTKYRIFEVSDLPLENAANPFTDFSIMVKEVDMDKTEYLAAILGSEAKAKAFLEKTGMKEKALQDAGIESKEIDPKLVEPPVSEKVKTAVASAQTEKPGDTIAIVEAVMKAMDIDGLNDFVLLAKEAIEKVPVLESVIKEMQGDSDKQLAEKINPPVSRFAWARKERASASATTKVEEDDELVKKAPGLGNNWLSEATGTTPIEAEEVHA